MSKLTVFDMQGATVGDLVVADELLVLDRGERAVHDAVVSSRANRRAGTASTLSKGEVAGSNRKPWRQKGTGRARAGYRQSPLWRGGSVAFGPHPRSYRRKTNRKALRLAFRRALSEKIASGEVKVVETLDVGEAKTRLLAGVLKALGVNGPALLVCDAVDRNLGLAARNLPRVEAVRAADVNVYQLLRYPVVVATRSAMEGLTSRLSGGQVEASR